MSTQTCLSMPSIVSVLSPMAKELGRETFRLMLASATFAELGRCRSWQPANGEGETRDLLSTWAGELSAAGWGEVVVESHGPNGSRVRVVNPAELLQQRELPPHERWGCPLLFGAVVLAFTKTLGATQWATETLDRSPAGDSVTFTVFPSSVTIEGELASSRNRVTRELERQVELAVGEQTRSLEQARELLRARARELRQEIDEREKAEKVKDEIVSVVNHELRTPLTSVRGFAELIRERDLPREAQIKYASIMCSEAERLTELLNNFLDVQRLDSGAQQYDWSTVQLEPLLRQVADVFLCNSHRIEIEADSGVRPVRADRQRLQQVLMNLVSNAMKFSPDANRITLSLRGTGDRVEVAVRDYGMGIPSDKIDKLFRMFYRVDNEPTRRIGGTGLGLVIAKRIVEDHGGVIAVESMLGEGSTFRIELPADTSSASAA